MRTTNPGHKTLAAFSLALVLVLLCFHACSYISPYSHFAYQQATSLKAEALALMDKATEPYANHEEQISELETELEFAYEYAKGRPKNELSTKQWQILKDPNRNLLGGFIKRWKEESTLSSEFIREARGIVADAFDTISGLESGKIKKSEVK